MATIIKGKNARKPWTVRYYTEAEGKIGARDGDTLSKAVRPRMKERSFPTKKLAEDFKAKFEHDSRESIFVDPRNGRVAFVTYAAGWINGLDRADTTKRTYRSVLNARIAPALGGRSLADVAKDREGVWALISGLDLSASRKTAALGVITGACDEAVRAGRIGRHMLAGLTVSKDAQAPAVIIPATGEQMTRLAGDLRPEMSLTIWLMRGCGLRISEALAVRLSNFRDGGRVLRICEQVTRDGELGPLKARKRGEYRDVPVPSWLWAKVQAHVAGHGTDDGYLFGRNGRRVTYSMQHERFLRSAGKAGLAGMTEHGLRHLYVSTLLSAGVPITDVATWVGHRDIRVTHAVYGHLLPDSWTRGREALETLAA